jgi:UDP-N-acetylmuramoyl-tripeptide--D-alanyl-D-alanine ligase
MDVLDSLSLHELAAGCGGELLTGAPEVLISRVSTDSRKIQLGDLFMALVGDKFDAHDYLGEVAQKGAAGVVIARSKAPLAAGLARALGVILVDDTRAALGKLGQWYRARFKLPVVAVAGSNGKTTTKELAASILRQRFRTLWSEASFNNDIGVPLTLLQLTRDHGAAVLEVGTNHPGELAPLLRMTQPGYGILTNIGREHLEFFGDLDGVIREEGGLAEFLPASGKLFINGDGEWTPAIVRRAAAGIVTVGFGDRNDWRARKIRVGEDGVCFEAEAPLVKFSGEYRLRLLGRHQVPNALLALAAGAELGVTPEEARRGLEECAPAEMRLQLWEAHGVRVLDDAYNANADSMDAALITLCDLPCSGRRVAVLGEMAELGAHAAAAHREMGRRAAELGIDRLVAVGRFAGETAEAARAAGLAEIAEVPDVAGAARLVSELARPGDLVLLKASRATGLEKVGEALRQREPSRRA